RPDLRLRHADLLDVVAPRPRRGPGQDADPNARGVLSRTPAGLSLSSAARTWRSSSGSRRGGSARSSRRLLPFSSTGIFVATTIVIALTAWIGVADALPAVLGVWGTLVLFFACVLLIREAGLAVGGINEEMAFSIRLRDLYRSGTMEDAVPAEEVR